MFTFETFDDLKKYKRNKKFRRAGVISVVPVRVSGKWSRGDPRE